MRALFLRLPDLGDIRFICNSIALLGIYDLRVVSARRRRQDSNRVSTKVRGYSMNPKAQGAFEAISYIREFSKRHGSSPRFRSMLDKELTALIDDVASDTAIDFRLRLKHPT